MKYDESVIPFPEPKCVEKTFLRPTSRYLITRDRTFFLGGGGGRGLYAVSLLPTAVFCTFCRLEAPFSPPELINKNN